MLYSCSPRTNDDSGTFLKGNYKKKKKKIWNNRREMRTHAKEGQWLRMLENGQRIMKDDFFLTVLKG